MKKKLFSVLTLCLLVLVLGSIPVHAKTHIRKVQKKTMYVGETCTLKIKGNKKAKWSSSNKSVATVSKKGIVKAKKTGKCVIKAVANKGVFRFKLTVKKMRPGENNDISVNVEMPRVQCENNDISVNVEMPEVQWLYSYNSDGTVYGTLAMPKTGIKVEIEQHNVVYYKVTVNYSVIKLSHQTIAANFVWTCYNSNNRIVKQGVCTTENRFPIYPIRGSLVFYLESGSYTIKFDNYKK